jgi:release factor glutamine methyltransferase
VREVREAWVELLADSGVEGAAQEVRWILERATGRAAAEQTSELVDALTDRQLRLIERLVARRAAGEPLQYVLGSWGFRTLDLLVDRRVLIPRPETEVVAGLALDSLPEDRAALVVDLGTGSGAIALSLAAERWPNIEVWATDASRDAIAVARANLAGLGRRAAAVRLVEGSWFDALPDELRGRVDLIVSNPPYVADGDPLPASVVDWEPSGALRAGPDGLDDLRQIIRGAPEWLTPAGHLVLEIGETQGAAVLDLAASVGFGTRRIERDLTGRDRALVAARP